MVFFSEEFPGEKEEGGESWFFSRPKLPIKIELPFFPLFLYVAAVGMKNVSLLEDRHRAFRWSIQRREPFFRHQRKMNVGKQANESRKGLELNAQFRQSFLLINWIRQRGGVCFRPLSSLLLPLCRPMRKRSLSLGLCLILKVLTASRSFKAIRAISLACKSPFLSGSPDTTMYASPIVSTLYTS